jgi:hypothetical protein
MSAEDRDPFDVVERTSLAFRELVRQRSDVPPPTPEQKLLAALTGDDSGPPVIDLEPIWRAALADDSNPNTIGARRYLSPKRFVNRWANWVDSRDDSDGRIRVDEEAAFVYCQRIDDRVMDAAYLSFKRRRDAKIGEDPVGAAVEATKGGALAMMMVAPHAAQAAGLSVEELREAMLERARLEAEDLDDIAAESLLARVHQAIGSPPRP